MRLIIDIPNDEIPKKQEYMEIGLHFIDGTVCECTYPFLVLPKGHGDLIDRDILLQNWKVIPSRDRLIFDRYIQILNGVIPADKGE